MLDAFLGKFSKEQRKELSDVHGIHWEEVSLGLLPAPAVEPQ